MREVTRILQFVQERAPEPVVLATVVSVEGSHYRRCGAQIAFDAAGVVAGALGGSCLDADLRDFAEPLFRQGGSLIREYELDSESDVIWGLGLGCGGKVTILLERLDTSSTLAGLTKLDECLAARTPAALVTVYGSTDQTLAAPGARLLVTNDATVHCDVSDTGLSDTLKVQAVQALALADTSSRQLTIDGATIDVLIQYIPPQLVVVIWGAGEDALPLLIFAKRLNWSTTLIDHRAAALDPARFREADRLVYCPVAEVSSHNYVDERTAVVLLSHNFQADLSLVKAFLTTAIPYIGLLGSKTRTAALIRQLTAEAPELTESLTRLYSPVGLDIGATEPESIALAIVAEIQAVFSGREGGSLRKSLPAPLEAAQTPIEILADER